MLGNIEKNKELIQKYPFLLPRNVWTDEVPTDYDYTYVEGDYDIPKGWYDLFLQMCEDLKESLVKSDCLDKFRFEQIKEKYGQLVVYTGNTTEEILKIIEKYGYISQFICCVCGQPARYVTHRYICPYCEKCIAKENKSIERVDFDPVMIVMQYTPKGSIKTSYDCTDIWNRLYKINQNI